MQLLPTARAIHLTVAGFACLAFGAALSVPDMSQMGGAIVLGLFASRAFSYLSVARARAAGFEMLWRTERKLLAAARLEQLELWVELQNRDTNPMEFRNLAALAGPGLQVSASPSSGTIRPRSSLFVRIFVMPKRIGVHGVFGLSLETIRAPGLFHAPLVFSNSLAVEVHPRYREAQNVLGHARRMTMLSSSRPSGGVSASVGDFRELREHRPGDPYHRIAWKPSARRGKLLLIDYEVSDQETTWILLDASQELFRGGESPALSDIAGDIAARLIWGNIARGSRVGLMLTARRILLRVPPARGSGHARRLLARLTLNTHTSDSDRSGWSVAELEALVREHMHFLAPERADKVRFDPEGFLRLADELALRAPFRAPTLVARTAEEGRLRRYLFAHGIQSPPSAEVDRPLSELMLAQQMRELLAPRGRPSAVHMIARWPSSETPQAFVEQLAVLSRARVRVHFHPISSANDAGTRASPKGQIAGDALQLLENVRAERARERLTQLGILVSDPASGPKGLGGSQPNEGGLPGQWAARE
jgi:uncharacterized protein (DUF58 family)